VADDNLSDLAWGIGHRWGHYLAFEEDAAFAIVFYDRPEWWRAELEHRKRMWDDMVPGHVYTAEDITRHRNSVRAELAKSDDELRAQFWPIVTRWNPEDKLDAIRARGAEKRRTYRQQAKLFVGDRVWLGNRYREQGPFTIVSVRPLTGRDENGARFRLPRRGIVRRERGV